MSKVKMVSNKETKEVVNAYAGSTKEFGFVQLSQETPVFNGNRVNIEKRSCLFRGYVSDLKTVQESFPTGEMPGKIRVIEVTEDAAKRVAAGMADMNNEGDRTAKAELHADWIKSERYEDAVKGFVKKIKRNPSDEFATATVRLDGERILRFQVYDQTGQLPDIKLQHNSVDDAEAEIITEKTGE